MKSDYVIIGNVINTNPNIMAFGDTELITIKDYLICVYGEVYEEAEKILNQILNNPTEDDKSKIQGYANLKIKFVDKKDCRWQDFQGYFSN